MKFGGRLLLVIGIVAATAAAAAAAAEPWGRAREIPKLITLDPGYAGVSSVSCVGAGRCAAIGTYGTGSGRSHAFVTNEARGVWGAPHDIGHAWGAARVTAGAPALRRSS